MKISRQIGVLKLALVLVMATLLCDEHTRAEMTGLPSTRPTGAEEVTSEKWRAIKASWKDVRRVLETGKPIRAELPVYYLSRFEVDRLSAAQKQDILRIVRQADLWRDVWFIVVKANRVDRGYYTTTVYFKPDFSEGRVRRGKQLHVSNRLANAKFESNVWPPLRGLLADYIQFGEEPPEKFQPYPQNLPFRMPEGFTVDEIVEIAAVIHAGVEDPDPGAFRRRAHAGEAILRITRKGDEVQVWTGSQEGPLSGRGELISLKKENGKWVVLSIGHWVS